MKQEMKLKTLLLLPLLGFASSLIAKDQQQAPKLQKRGIFAQQEIVTDAQVNQANVQAALLAAYALLGSPGILFKNNVDIAAGNSLVSSDSAQTTPTFLLKGSTPAITAQGTVTEDSLAGTSSLVTGAYPNGFLTVTASSGTNVAITGDVVVYHNLTVEAGATLAVSGDLRVLGAMTLKAGSTLTVGGSF